MKGYCSLGFEGKVGVFSGSKSKALEVGPCVIGCD